MLSHVEFVKNSKFANRGVTWLQAGDSDAGDQRHLVSHVQECRMIFAWRTCPQGKAESLYGYALWNFAAIVICMRLPGCSP